ncbi:phage adaptor protein [Shinella sp.]|uniref:phage adaptor protein n=1 Tax=Shinella sp. TaxID=1870904 RepID=UPI0040374CE3
MTYDEFISHINALCIRDDAPIVTFIRRAEAYLRPLVKHYLAEKSVTLTVTDGTTTLPADFIEIRSITGTLTYKPVSPTSATLLEGQVGYFRVADDLVFVGEPDSTVDVVYHSAFPDLTETQSNWLFDRHVGVYLASVMKAFYQFEKDPEGVQIENQALQEALGVVAEDDRRGRVGGVIIMDTGTWL